MEDHVRADDEDGVAGTSQAESLQDQLPEAEVAHHPGQATCGCRRMDDLTPESSSNSQGGSRSSETRISRGSRRSCRRASPPPRSSPGCSRETQRWSPGT